MEIMLIAVIIIAAFIGVNIPRVLAEDRAAELDAAVELYWRNSRGY